ncbi:nodulation protein [Mesorhizobium sp. CU2]|uniref:efflux RND transporter permease subunit n=2 Tax=Mesorhizobium TaxID=68287 RepID=UPI001127CD03|nr:MULTISPECIES: efflux RND transporter permease subunit [unclassified Mesorhizobium]TPN76163.1 nodulation protein [Mesorhizobium sp. CU3]TPO02471.1 nodulation protein [Mesorhizobium sp. CU2]
MNLSAPFIARPVATTLLAIGLAAAGLIGYFNLPVAPLPKVDFPTISVQASMAGASPDTMATDVAAPLERHLGQIAGVSEMTSRSSTGSTNVVLQFDLDRDINGAARDVQAAINAARADLPSDLRSNPTYRKYNPADAPVMILALTSRTLTPGQLYDAAATVLQQRLSQVEGVGNVDLGGSSLPAVRVELNPGALFHYGIGLEDVRAALASANARSPKGFQEDGALRYQLYTNDQASHAADFRDLVIAWRNNAAVKLRDIADVEDSIEDVRNLGLANGVPAVLLVLYREPNANIIDTVDRIRALIPTLQASVPADAQLSIATDGSTTIRGSLHDTELTLVLAVLLVVAVVFCFLRDWRAALIPSVALVVSILGTFGAMYLLGFTLDNLSLMALTIATGFVVDDAIVVLENIMRHIEDGMPRGKAALVGAQEVGFTVLSMSASLVAVFLPILLMGGILGRLFQEFALTLSLSIAISLVLSLTVTPMMCAHFLRKGAAASPSRSVLARFGESVFERVRAAYGRSLAWSLDNGGIMLVVLLATVVFNVYLYTIVPKGFFPQQDTGELIGGLRADQAISFQLMRQKFEQLEAILKADPAVQNVVGYIGGRQTNSGFVQVALKPKGERAPLQVVLTRLRAQLGQLPGAQLFLNPRQEIRVGGRQSLATYQYTLQADAVADLDAWVPKLVDLLKQAPELTDVNSDRDEAGLETNITVDRESAARLGLTPASIDATLYDAFGQRQVSTIFNARNQYHVVMEVAPRYLQDPSALNGIYVSTAGATASGTQQTNALAGSLNSSLQNQANNAIAVTGHGSASSGAAVSTSSETMVPLSAFSTYGPATMPLSVNHQGHFVATTISFNLADGATLGDASAAIDRAMAELKMPVTIHGALAGTALAFRANLLNELLLIAAALATIYVVLGVLYESYVHPITILSTLPSAGIGALLALIVTGMEFDVISLIGIILLIGIVKKNAIMMIDMALQAERQEGLSARAAIHKASVQRFRPIMMTTFAALLGALPLAIETGTGAELRQPLGAAIVGGLIVSQLLTLYTTPVVYLYLDRLSVRKPSLRLAPAE